MGDDEPNVVNGPRGFHMSRTNLVVGVLLIALFTLALVGLGLTGASDDLEEVRSDGVPDDNSYMDTASYNGSTECGVCHQSAHDSWADTLHPTKMRVASASTVVGDWNTDPVLTVGDGVQVTVSLSRDGSKFIVDLDGTATQVYQVDYVLGGEGWMQRYLVTLGNSRYVLPIQWNIATEEWVGYDVEDWYEATGDLRTVALDRSWDLNCAGCHVTGFEIEHNETSGEWTASWAELGVGCEACHGPGSLHINPPSGRQRTEFIWKTVDSTLCGSCHNRGTSIGMLGGEEAGYPLDASGDPYRPGDDLDQFFVSHGIYYPDGETSMRHRQQYPDYTTHPHSSSLNTILESPRGQETCLKCHSTDYMLAVDDEKPALEAVQYSIECVACHDPHGSSEDHDLRVQREQVCTQCHQTFDAPPGETVHHPQMEMVSGTINIPGIDGNPWMGGDAVCADCHMPLVAKGAVEYDIASHSFYLVSPAKSISYDMPNSCTVSCHGGQGGTGMTLTDQEALNHIESWRADITDLLPDAEAGVDAAAHALELAEDYGFSEETIEQQTERYNMTLEAKEYVVSDGTMVHNHDFAMQLLNYAVNRSAEVVDALTPGTVTGLVKDADGKAVANAQVRTGDKVWATTGSDGGFSIDIAPGTYTFGIYEADDMTKEFVADSPSAGGTNDVGTIKYDGNGSGDDGGILIWIIVITIIVIVVFAALLMSRSRHQEE